jgi:hypothetical protein
VRLLVKYTGDAARLSYNGTLLNDDWYTAYEGAGQFQLGLSYLNEENGGALDPASPPFTRDSANSSVALELRVLPLSRAALESHVWLRRDLWPAFDADGTALRVDGVEPLLTFRATLLP